MPNPTNWLWLSAAVALSLGAVVNASTSPPAPPSVSWSASTGKLSISYQGKTIFAGRVAKGAAVTWEERSMPAEPVPLGYGHGPKDAGGVPPGLRAQSIVVRIKGPAFVEGAVSAGADALACVPEDGPEIVRGCLGQSWSLLNRGVFDRAGDWALYVPEPAKCRVTCTRTTARSAQFGIEASGQDVTLVLDKEFYRVHRGYFHWDPSHKLWTRPVAGWCSWAAHGGGVKEEDVIAAADLFSRELLDYGYDVIQIDDGYQMFSQGDPKPLEPGQSMADFWLNSNDRFPHGMEWIAKQISVRGLTPGIWMSMSEALGMPEGWYVKASDGKPFRGEWANWAINGLIPEAVDAAFLRTFRGLKKQGWGYFKVDTVRHVIYDHYRECPDYWRSRNEEPELAFRALFRAVKKEIGPSIYMLSCWGVIPEMAGIPDGCRIGEDVRGDWGHCARAAKFTTQFNYANNIIWRNDPDYMCLSVPVAQARSWASYVALTGMQTMVSDKAREYDESRLDVLRKIGPPLFVRPTTLHSLKPDAELWLTEFCGPEEPYVVLGRIAWAQNGLPARSIAFADLGLDPSADYLVWDFWHEKLIGRFRGEFPSERLDQGDCRVYAIRPALDRPQLLSTNRHISQGAYEVSDVTWRDGTLSGRMKLPPKRPYSIYIYVPDGFGFASASAQAGLRGRVLALTLKSERAAAVDWSARFSR